MDFFTDDLPTRNDMTGDGSGTRRSDQGWIAYIKARMLYNGGQSGEIQYFSGSATGEDPVSRYFINKGYSVTVINTNPPQVDPFWITQIG